MLELLIIKDKQGFGFTVCGENPPVVESVSSGSPAFEAGLQENDTLISINGLMVKHAPHDVIVNFMRAKDSIDVCVLREENDSRSLNGADCKYCGYPPLVGRIDNKTHPEPSMMALVLYLGSMEVDSNDASLATIYKCVQHLHQDSQLKTLVCLDVNETGITVRNSARRTISFHSLPSLRFCGMWPQDKRYFGLITQKGEVSSCHVFMCDCTKNETFVNLFGYTGLTVTSKNGSTGHKHKLHVATHIVRGLASVFSNRTDIQVDQAKVKASKSKALDTDSVFYDTKSYTRCNTKKSDQVSGMSDRLSDSRNSTLSLRSIHYDTQSVVSSEPYTKPEETNTTPSTASPTHHFSPVIGESGRIAEWAKGFDKLLEDPDGVKCFQEYLKKEYADENISFWLACRHYESITDPKKREEEASLMIAEYLVSGAPNPINIDAIGRADVIHSAHLAGPELFKHMQKQIYNLMKYGKFWQFTHSSEYLNLLEQEKIGKTPVFDTEGSQTLSTENKRTKRRNIVSDSSLPRNRRFFSSFLGLIKRERLSENDITVSNNYVLLEMPNCTVRRAHYSSNETVKTCIERALYNTGINCHCYHICVKKSGEVLDINRPVSNFCSSTLSLYNTPTFQILLLNGKKVKFCTSRGKTLKDICKITLAELNVDLRSSVFYDRDNHSYVRMDTSCMLVAGKLLEIRDISQRSMLPKLNRKMSNKSTTRRGHGMGGCSGSLESNLDLLSSVMESSDDEIELNQPACGLVRSYSQSELEFFELLNRVQCDRLDNQRCSHPTVLKNLTFGDRRDSFKNSKRHSRKHYKRNTLPKVDSQNMLESETTPKESPLEIYDSDEDIAYC